MQNVHEPASRQLKQKVIDLTGRFLRGRQPDFLRQHARALDDYFEQAFETSMIGPRLEINKNPYAIVALGGYGREEQCVHSDVDLLILFGKGVPKHAEELIREMIYPLWDIGMDVGYATRSVKECLRLAGGDLNILTPLLNARFVCGMSMLFSDLMTQLMDKIVRKRSEELFKTLVETTRVRHAQYGNSADLLEPNLKEGQGGLRDYHTMLWLARLKHDVRQPRDLEYFGLLSHSEYQDLRGALGLIWDVRNRLHHLCGRKCDQLHFENQIKIAEQLRFKAASGQQPVERFLGELHARMGIVKQQHLMLTHELGLAGSRRRPHRAAGPKPMEGLELNAAGMLCFTGPEEILKRPELLIRIFEEGLHLKAPLSAEARRLVREFAYLLDSDLRASEEIVRAFERLLLAATASEVLDDMLGTGFLQAFIPEFGAIVNRVQYDEYHLFPVDKHLLRTVHMIKRLGEESKGSEPLGARLYRELKNKTALLWAALLHDIGKASPDADHSSTGAEIARGILASKGLKPAAVDAAAFLVREHLFLIKTATRRDIHDEETAIACALRIKDTERLKMLYLLTVADAAATGPAAWNDWTSHLLREFFFKVLNILEKGELATEEAVAVIKRKHEALVASAGSAETRAERERIFPVLSPRYLLAVPEPHIAEHIELFRRLGPADFAWDIRRSPDGSGRTVTICAKDRPGLVASIAGVFTLNNINILDVQVFTWRNHTALDIFEVTPPPDLLFEDDKWRRAEGHLKAVLTGEMDLRSALQPHLQTPRFRKQRAVRKPHRVRVDNAGSSFFTIVEVFTHDFPGLLYSVTDALFQYGLDIWVAKIATKVDQVVDVFYVRDVNGQKVDDPQRVEDLKKAVLERLPSITASA